jgi:HD-GYP domain-containing protein (c-di-GMP phosphodiesterase class II)
MNIRMDQLVRAIAVALDIVEGELLGASTNHGKRIAVLSAAMGRYFGMDNAALSALTTCALFHDSALTEYIISEQREHDPAMKTHCQFGQRNAEALLFNVSIDGFVLYHHERPDGGGPFGRKEGEIPLEAAIIAIADMLDVANHLQRVETCNLHDLRMQIVTGAGTQFAKKAADALLAVLDEDMLVSLGDERIRETAEQVIPVWNVVVEDKAVFHIAALVARIIDYKSVFTRRHSVQIANKAWLMSMHYGYDKPLGAEMYLAAAIHDIGKLAIPLQILEKPGRLSDMEFRIIMEHAHLTWEILKDINGFEEICGIASSHHEKLDGSGYPFGKKAEDLDFNSRLMACIDIYQAVSEERPYHSGRSHEDTMPILYDMAEKGYIDKKIAGDIDTVMAPWSNQDVPPPPDAVS